MGKQKRHKNSATKIFNAALKTLIVIAGPTASGKTDLAIEIAKHYQTDILSADSRQCFREMSIGVAKPSEDQLASTTHYFIHSHAITEHVSAGMYERYALEKLNHIFSKNDVAVCVGGTGMYIKAVCEGIDEMPEVDASMYEAIETAYNEKGIDWLKEEVRKTDETFFNEGEIENPARLMRALTFKQSTGQSILDFRTNTIKNRNFTTIKYAIDIDRELLYQRINTRVDGMLDAGLMNEVKALLPYRNLNSLNTVGYTELFNYIDGVWSLAQSIDKIKQHTRNYAKRQITWFKHQGNYRWLKAEDIAKDAFTIR